MSRAFWRAVGSALVFASLLAACSTDPGSKPASSSPSRSVFVAQEAFGFWPDRTTSYESVLLSGQFDIDVAVSALRRAGARFILVTEDGTEHLTEESVFATGLYNPNYVADPKVRADGIEFYVDCKGVIEPPMAATFRRILREELEAARIVDARVTPITA
jgi:hypothetical protein